MNARRNRIAWGTVLIIVAVLGLEFPWFSANGIRFSVSQAHGACSSSLGQLAQVLSSSASYGCGTAGVMYWVLILAGIGGLALIVWGFRTPRAPRPPQAPPRNLSELPKPPGYR